MEYVFWWFILAVPCFFINYCNGAALNGRLIRRDISLTALDNTKQYVTKGFYLFVHDYFGVHCPWSWERAKKYRLADTRFLLGKKGCLHYRLGYITADDCDVFGKQEEIARYAYITRVCYWNKGLLYFIFAPIHVILTFLYPGVPK